ncbi:MAG TPA: succinyl-diaminopimelate desuccinylase [Actinomycetota bacterium]
MVETDRSGRRPDIVTRLAARTLALSTTHSVSRDEDAILASISEQLRAHDSLEFLDQGDSVVFAGPRVRRVDAPFVVLAGHVDTVPIAGARMPAEQEGEAIIGRGTSDMKAGLAVMLEIASDMAHPSEVCDLDVGYLFFGREELPINESALLPLFDRCPAASTIELAIVMEPTDNAIEVGCLGNLNAEVIVEGTAAHSARPWLGENAIHAAIEALAPLADLPDRDVTIDGLTFREVVSVTMIEGGIASNVVPDRVTAHVNYRYAPTHAPAEAEARLRELLGHRRARVEIVGNAPPGSVNVANPLVQRLRRAGDLRLGPKQAWTPVAEFATVNVDAVNFGPGDPQYAHRDDERVEVAAIVRSYEVLRGFLGLDGGSDGSRAAGGDE